MTTIEIILIMIGIIFMIGSFFMTEKLSDKELNEISQLSTEEMKRILEKNMTTAEEKVDVMIDESIEQSIDKVEVALSKETNEKIKAISEYSETVLESINKTHNEVMFLYSMLNDKHTELTDYASKMQDFKTQLEQLEEDVMESISVAGEAVKDISDRAASANIQTQLQGLETFQDYEAKEEEKEILTEGEELEEFNHNRAILKLHKERMPVIEIAKKLGLGLGEVKLVLDLYRGEGD